MLVISGGFLLASRYYPQSFRQSLAEYKVVADGNGTAASWDDDLEIALTAPDKVAEGGSFNIQMDYKRERYPAGTHEKISFTLVSTAFDYKPSGSIEAPPCYAPGENTAQAEKRFIWNLSPIAGKTGEQELFIEIAGVNFQNWTGHTPSFPTTLNFTRNGEEGRIDEILKHVIPIKIEIVSAFGIPAYLIRVLQFLAGLCGFVLTYPVIVELVKKRFVGSRPAQKKKSSK
jgi:hypothetical protein